MSETKCTETFHNRERHCSLRIQLCVTVEGQPIQRPPPSDLGHAVQVPWDDMVNEAQDDLESGTNRYHAYLILFMNTEGGTSRLAEFLLDLSPPTVGNVNEVAVADHR